MQRLIVTRSRVAIAVLLSISLLFLYSSLSPVFPQSNTQSAVFDQVWQTVNDNFMTPN